MDEDGGTFFVPEIPHDPAPEPMPEPEPDPVPAFVAPTPTPAPVAPSPLPELPIVDIVGKVPFLTTLGRVVATVATRLFPWAFLVLPSAALKGAGQLYGSPNVADRRPTRVADTPRSAEPLADLPEVAIVARRPKSASSNRAPTVLPDLPFADYWDGARPAFKPYIAPPATFVPAAPPGYEFDPKGGEELTPAVSPQRIATPARPIAAPFRSPFPVEMPFSEPFAWPLPGSEAFPVPSPSPEPFPVPGPAPAPSPEPLASPQPVPQPFSTPFPSPFAEPISRPLPRSKPRSIPRAPAARPRPLPISQPFGFASPLQGPKPAPLTEPKKPGVPLPQDNCVCDAQQPKPRKKRQPRSVCKTGTYTETANGLIKKPKETVQCR